MSDHSSEDGEKLRPDEDLARAFGLQEEIRRKRREIRELEAEYNDLISSLAEAKVGRIGSYELVTKVQQRRSIDSDLFRARWPEVFNKIARITLKDAEASLRPEDMGEFSKVLRIERVIRHSIVSYEVPLQR